MRKCRGAAGIEHLLAGELTQFLDGEEIICVGGASYVLVQVRAARPCARLCQILKQTHHGELR